VRDDSPAFKANLMRGDVVIQIADKPVVSIQDANDLLSAYAGQKVQITVIRDTQTLVFEVQLNQKS
jgi:C-terminal processing protease CtpA/Prc